MIRMKNADLGALDLFIQRLTIRICPASIDIGDDALAFAVKAVPRPPLMGFVADK